MGCVEAVDAGQGLNPVTLDPADRFPIPNHGWVVSDTWRVSVDVVQAEVARWMPWDDVKYGDYSKARGFTNNHIEFLNGSTIDFKFSGQGRETFQGTSRHWIWFDEEPPEDVYWESYARTIDVRGHIWITMTPLKGFTWIYHTLWLNEDEDADVETFSIPLAANRFCPQSEIDRVTKRWGNTPMAESRLLGHFIPVGGLPVFDSYKLMAQLARAERLKTHPEEVAGAADEAVSAEQDWRSHPESFRVDVPGEGTRSGPGLARRRDGRSRRTRYRVADDD